MASLRDQFAGIVHFEVPPEHAAALADALQALQSTGLKIQVARSDSGPAPAGRRIVRLVLDGVDRPGIVRDLSSLLAERGVSIEDLTTDVVDGAAPDGDRFRLSALLHVPNALSDDALRTSLDGLRNEMRMDLALGERNG
jgi:glycine cleavage system regulatory protein